MTDHVGGFVVDGDVLVNDTTYGVQYPDTGDIYLGYDRYGAYAAAAEEWNAKQWLVDEYGPARVVTVTVRAV